MNSKLIVLLKLWTNIITWQKKPKNKVNFHLVFVVFSKNKQRQSSCNQSRD